jgi:acetoin utilization protein AcuB
MFSLYGLAGLDFRGTLEQLRQLPEVTAAQPSRAIGREEQASISSASGRGGQAGTGPGLDAAVQAYEDMLHEEQDRGPLYHAYQIMSREVITVGTGDPVESAWHSLMEHDIHQAPVLDMAHTLVGLVTERDLLTSFNLQGSLVSDVLPRQVADVMRSPVLSADPVTDIRRVARVMLDFRLAAMPVVNETGALVGIVSRGDILRAVVAQPPLSLWR